MRLKKSRFIDGGSRNFVGGMRLLRNGIVNTSDTRLNVTELNTKQDRAGRYYVPAVEDLCAKQLFRHELA
jgi:hypothetical protein